jgi:hypothetical protein
MEYNTTMKSKIKLVTHKHAVELRQSRLDSAIYTNQELVERSYWYENVETNQQYHELYACLGWPSEITNQDDSLPGYVAIVGVVRSGDESDPSDAKFQLLAEAESSNVPQLLGKCMELRAEYGFGIQKSLLTSWIGDPDRFLTTTALLNEVLIKDRGDTHAVLISPPYDWYTPKIFDMYVRTLRDVMIPGDERLFPGYNYILMNRLRNFAKDDPCVTAVGGLIHTLL